MPGFSSKSLQKGEEGTTAFAVMSKGGVRPGQVTRDEEESWDLEHTTLSTAGTKRKGCNSTDSKTLLQDLAAALLEAHDDLVCGQHSPFLCLHAGHHALQLRPQHIAHLHCLHHRHLLMGVRVFGVG